MLSGDFLFVGSLGRPDLLGDEQKEQLARQLFASVRDKLAGLPDGLEIYPGHGAGSLCGAGLGGRPLTTLGFERLTNQYLDPSLDEEEFVRRILDSAPLFPPYYLRMKALNAQGADYYEPAVAALDPFEFRALSEEGHFVVDVRDRNAFSGGHVPGSLASDPGKSLVVWASWLAPADKPILLVTHDEDDAEYAARVFARVGLDEVVGYLDGGMRAWQEAGFPVGQVRWARLDDLPAGTPVLDVRAKGEFDEGHVEGATQLFLGEIEARLDEVPDPVALICRTGDRSTVAASVLQAHGRTGVYNVAGGMRALENR